MLQRELVGVLDAQLQQLLQQLGVLAGADLVRMAQWIEDSGPEPPPDGAAPARREATASFIEAVDDRQRRRLEIVVGSVD